MASVRAALTILASAGCAGSVTLKSERQSHLFPYEASDPCACIPWPDAYGLHKVKCGEGHEMDDTAPGQIGVFAALAQIPKADICQNLYGRLPANESFCMRVSSDMTSKKWCYVSKACKTDATYPWGPAKLKSKICSSNDNSLDAMNFDTLAKWSYANHLELGHVVQSAYPTWSFKNEYLDNLLGFWNVTNPTSLPLRDDLPKVDEAMEKRLKVQVASGLPMVFKSMQGHGVPLAVSEGEKLYWIQMTEAYHSRMLINVMMQEKQHEKTFLTDVENQDSWLCIAGCGKKTGTPF